MLFLHRLASEPAMNKRTEAASLLAKAPSRGRIEPALHPAPPDHLDLKKVPVALTAMNFQFRDITS
jgi:hypothetical protein